MFARTLVAASLWLGALAAPVLAQSATPERPAQEPRGPGRGNRMAMLLTGITLSPPQQAQIDSLSAWYQSQLPRLDPGSPPDEATRARMRELGARQLADIRAVLTEEQRVVFDQNVAQRRRGPGGPGARP